MNKYECIVCGFTYDEAVGIPDDGIAPGTKWEDIPADWTSLTAVQPKKTLKWSKYRGGAV